jgi:hypothetical protein
MLFLVVGCSVQTSAISPQSSFDSGSDALPDSNDGDSRFDGDSSTDAEIPLDAEEDGSEGDASPGDAGDDATADTEPAPDPTWTVIETMMVDSADPEPTYSTTVLAAGVVYRLRASGTVTNVIGTSEGDADWWDFADPKDNGCCEDIGLGIDDFVVDDLDTQPDWGPYDPSHIYEVEWIGDGSTIAALYQDTYYGNNIGVLTLEILELR